MKTWLLRIIWLLLLGCLASGLRAQPLDIGAATPLPDMAGALSASPRHTPLANAQQALALYRRGGFDKLPGSLGRGYSTAEVWLAFDLQARPGAPELLIVEVGPAYLDHVTAYQADSAGQIVLLGRSGDQTPKAQVALLAFKPSFAIRPPPGGSTTVLLQIQTTSSQSAIVKLYRAADYPAQQASLGLVLGAIFATSLIMVILALGMYVVLRDTGYLVWLLYALVCTLQWFMIDGLGYRYLDWANLRHLNLTTNLLTFLSLSTGALFVSTFFEFSGLHRWLHRGFLIGAAMFVLVGCTGLLLGYPVIVGVVSLLSFPYMGFTVIALLLQMRRGHRLSLWHGPLFLLYLLAAFINLLAAIGKLSYSDLIFYGWQIAGFINLLSLQVAMFVRARQVQRDHAQERAGLLDQLTRQNQALEEQVTARTASLSDALRSVQQAESEQRQLLSMASHEFRTPAAVIKASLDSLTYLQDSIAPEVQTRLANMRQASERMTHLSNNLIDQDRLIELALKPQLRSVDMRQLVTEVLSRYPESAQVQAHLPSESPATAVLIQGDAALLSIALHNLIDNALRYGQSAPGHSLPVSVSLRRQAGELLLEVADCGPGIADDQKAKVFERFHAIPKKDPRTTETNSGPAHAASSSGLGLAIVQSIAQAHGGQASVRDNLPHGAVLVLHLPTTNSEEKQLVAPVQSAQAAT